MTKALVLAAALIAGSASPALAEPVTVGSLDIDWSGVGVVALHTASGFAYTGTVSASDGDFPMWLLNPTRSAPGVTLDAGAYWTGLAVRGTAFDGTSHTVGTADSDDWGDLRFTASALMPSLDVAETTLSVPFAFESLFHFLDSTVSLTGDGLMALQFRRNAEYGYWDFVSARYQFGQATSAHAPEPTTVLLLTTGLVGLFVLRRRANRIAVPVREFAS
jgi:hypothetical protein